MTAGPATTPTFSVVVPTRNRPDALARCLGALAALDYPRDRFEVIVVDDGGADSVRSADPALARMDIRILHKSHGGPGAARNFGVRNARGEYIAFTDDDCLPEPGWLSAFEAAFRTDPGALLGGHTVNGLESNLYATSSQLLIDYLHDYYNPGPEGPRFFTSNNMAVGRDAFLAAGGFDPIFVRAAAEDRELCARWLRQGHPRIHVPGAVVLHEHHLTLRRFLVQHFRYGQGAHYFHLAESRHGSGRIRVEPPRFYLRLILLPLRRLGPLRGIAAAALIGMSQIANSAGFVWERNVAARQRRHASHSQTIA